MTLPPHLEVLEGFIRAAEQVPDDQWNRAPADGRWSPAQVAEHLRLTYVVTRPELRGGQGFRVRTSRWKQWLFQLLRAGTLSGQRAGGARDSAGARAL